jgi:Domain of unknown function (DUF1841)
MYNPTRDQARQLFIDAWHKEQHKLPQTPLEALAADIVRQHPEYHVYLTGDQHLARDWTPEQGETNPFLHLSLHLAIAEHLKMNQPIGIVAAYQALCQQTGDTHAALHCIHEALAETLWQAQRNPAGFDPTSYLTRIQNQLKAAK